MRKNSSFDDSSDDDETSLASQMSTVDKIALRQHNALLDSSNFLLTNLLMALVRFDKPNETSLNILPNSPSQHKSPGGSSGAKAPVLSQRSHVLSNGQNGIKSPQTSRFYSIRVCLWSVPPVQQQGLLNELGMIDCVAVSNLEEVHVWISGLSSLSIPVILVGETANPVIGDLLAKLAKSRVVGRAGNELRSDIASNGVEVQMFEESLSKLREDLIAKNSQGRVIRLVRRHSKAFLAMIGFAETLCDGYLDNGLGACGVTKQTDFKILTVPQVSVNLVIVGVLKSIACCVLSVIEEKAKPRIWRDFVPASPRASESTIATSSETNTCPEIEVSPETPPPIRRVLVVEDSSLNARVMMRLLKGREGLEVLDHAVDGVDGVEKFCKAFESKEPYDVILMDCQMPRMDGLEATRKIREIEAQANLKERTESRGCWIAAVTAGAQDALPWFCEKAGMDGYVEKPIKKTVIQSALEFAERALTLPLLMRQKSIVIVPK